jgi:hypothetical protein
MAGFDKTPGHRYATTAAKVEHPAPGQQLGEQLVGPHSINDLLSRAENAITAARDETEGLPDDVVVTVREHLERLTVDD